MNRNEYAIQRPHISIYLKDPTLLQWIDKLGHKELEGFTTEDSRSAKIMGIIELFRELSEEITEDNSYGTDRSNSYKLRRIVKDHKKKG